MNVQSFIRRFRNWSYKLGVDNEPYCGGAREFQMDYIEVFFDEKIRTLLAQSKLSP
ncbi:MAG: hypothetical protein M3136_04505 [Thermoproteota archaeon]|nr:hypothetical protein [Thermoproteota archaeon]